MNEVGFGALKYLKLRLKEIKNGGGDDAPDATSIDAQNGH